MVTFQPIQPFLLFRKIRKILFTHVMTEENSLAAVFSLLFTRNKPAHHEGTLASTQENYSSLT